MHITVCMVVSGTEMRCTETAQRVRRSNTSLVSLETLRMSLVKRNGHSCFSL